MFQTEVSLEFQMKEVFKYCISSLMSHHSTAQQTKMLDSEGWVQYLSEPNQKSIRNLDGDHSHDYRKDPGYILFMSSDLNETEFGNSN